MASVATVVVMNGLRMDVRAVTTGKSPAFWHLYQQIYRNVSSGDQPINSHGTHQSKVTAKAIALQGIVDGFAKIPTIMSLKSQIEHNVRNYVFKRTGNVAIPQILAFTEVLLATGQWRVTATIIVQAGAECTVTHYYYGTKVSERTL